MTYRFYLKVEKEKSALVLLKDETVLGTREWLESRDMGQRLFAAIQELLQEKDLKSKEVSEFRVESEMPETYTSRRIAETVRRVYTYGVSSCSEKSRSE